MTKTRIVKRFGDTHVHEGTSGLTVTATRNGNDVHVDMEFDVATVEEYIAMIGTLLTQLEEIHGENMVAQCIAHYCNETGKTMKTSGRDFALIQGFKDGRR